MYRVVTQCNPPLVDTPSITNLVNQFKAKKPDVATKDEVCGGALGPVLDDLPRSHFEVLGSVCAYVRDCSKDVLSVTKGVATGILGSGSSKMDKELFQLLVDKAEPLFGRIAVAKTKARRSP